MRGKTLLPGKLMRVNDIACFHMEEQHIGKSIGFEVRRTQVKSQPLPLHRSIVSRVLFAFLNLSFLICKMGLIMYSP